MKLAVSKPTHTEEQRKLLFDSYRSFGYAGLQLKENQYADFLEGRVIEKRWLEDTGIFAALVASTALTEADNAKLRRIFEFAGRMGTELVVFHLHLPRKGVTDRDLRRYAQTLSEFGREARRNGLRLSLHHGYEQPVMVRPDFEVFYGSVEDDAVGLTVDTGILAKSGIRDIAGFIVDFKGLIDNFHIKDFDGKEFRLPGQGRLNFEPIFEAIREIEYTGWVSVDEETDTPISEGLPVCFRFLEKSLEP